MELRKLVALGLGAAAIAAGSAIPAGAHDGPGVCTIVARSANVANNEAVHVTANKRGLFYPPQDPIASHWQTTNGAGPLGIPAFVGDRYSWSLNGQCANGNVAGGGNFLSSGTGIGYCGRSVGVGTGTITGAGDVIPPATPSHTYIIRWESLGSQLILVNTNGTSTANPAAGMGGNPNLTAVGSVNAQPNPADSADGSCLDGTAVRFLVDGALAHM